MNDTPRTDAQAWNATPEHSVVWADFARELERELACFREENNRILTELARVTAERDQYKLWWERDSNGLGTTIGQLYTARAVSEDRRAQLAVVTAERDEYQRDEERQSCAQLQSGKDGVWAHFRVGNGYAFSLNLDCDPWGKRFSDEYRAMLAAMQERDE